MHTDDPAMTTKIALRQNLTPCVALLLTMAGAAQAETSPYYLGGSLGLHHVSNIYRQSNAANSDEVGNASLLAGLDQRLGRQRLFGDVSVQANRYRRNSELNNISYTAKLGLDWASIERLSGTLSASKKRSLADYNIGSGITPIFKKNTEDNSQLQGIARLGLVTKLTLEAVLTHRQREFSAIEYTRLNYREDIASLGLVWRPSSPLRLGLAARHTKGKNPRYLVQGDVVTPDEFTRNDIDLSAGWEASGASKLDARLSASRSSHSLSNLRDFSGVTGTVVWQWQPTAKWSLSTRLSRDSGLDTYYLGFVNLNTDYNRITKALQLNSSYELSGKLLLDAGLTLSSIDRSDTLFQSSSYDRDRAYNLGARWIYSRGLELGCQISHSGRSSSTAFYAYSANTYGCYGQAVIR